MASIERSRTPVIPPESDDRRRWSMEAVQRSNVRDSYSSNSSGFSLFDARVSYASSRTSPFVPGTNRVSPAPSPVGPPPRHEEWQSTTLPPIRGSHREEKLYFPMMLAPTPRRPSSPPPEPMSERAWLDGCTAPAPAPARGVEPGPCRSGSNRRHAGAGRVGPYSLDGPHLVSPHHPPSPTAATRPRRRGNLPREVTERLRHWFSTHLAHPYPTEDEKQQLMADTRLTLCQVWTADGEGPDARLIVHADQQLVHQRPSTTAAHCADGGRSGGEVAGASRAVAPVPAGRGASSVSIPMTMMQARERSGWPSSFVWSWGGSKKKAEGRHWFHACSLAPQ